MSFFQLVDNDLVMRSSGMVAQIATAEIARRSSNTLAMPSCFASVVHAMSDCPDSPKLRHWVSVSRSLIRSKLKVLDPEPRFVAHFFVDSLAASRIGELHGFRALEILLEQHMALKSPFSWHESSIQCPPQFNVWGVGTVVLKAPQRGVEILLSASVLLIRLGTVEIHIQLETLETDVLGEAAYEPSLIVSTCAGRVIVPLEVPGLSDCYHSNAPIVRGLDANREWTHTLRAAIDMLHEQDPVMARQCVQLAPAVLALHCGGTSYGSSSPQEVMGLVFLPGVTDPHDVAECYLHEALHQKLYRVEEGAPLFEGEHGDQEIYYSPWRSDARPLRMLVHGAYVFTGVSYFWKHIQTRCNDSSLKANAGFHCFYRARQAAIAMEIVDKYDLRTPMGVKISTLIRQGIADATEGVQVDSVIVAEAERRLAEHRAAFSRHVA